MIRIGLDVPTFTRIGLRAQLISRRINRRISKFKASLLGRNEVTVTHTPSRPIAYMDYNVVRGQFEELVDVLCFAAQHGITVNDANRYQQIRSWFGENGDRIHPMVAPYLRNAQSVARPSLLQSENLQTAVNTEGLLWQIQETHEALEAYRSFVEPETIH